MECHSDKSCIVFPILNLPAFTCHLNLFFYLFSSHFYSVQLIKESAPTTPKSSKSSSSSLATTPKKQQQQHEQDNKFNFTNDRNNNPNKWSPPSAPVTTSKQQDVSPPQTNGGGHYNANNNRFELEPEADDFIQQMTQDEVKADPPSSTLDYEDSPVPVESQKVNLEEGLGRAKYTFKAETESELSFKKVRIGPDNTLIYLYS